MYCPHSAQTESRLARTSDAATILLAYLREASHRRHSSAAHEAVRLWPLLDTCVGSRGRTAKVQSLPRRCLCSSLRANLDRWKIQSQSQFLVASHIQEVTNVSAGESTTLPASAALSQPSCKSSQRAHKSGQHLWYDPNPQEGLPAEANPETKEKDASVRPRNLSPSRMAATFTLYLYFTSDAAPAIMTPRRATRTALRRRNRAAPRARRRTYYSRARFTITIESRKRSVRGVAWRRVA